MRPEHLEHLLQPGTVSVHPGGTWAVVAVTRPSFAADDYVGQLWRLDLTGGAAPRRLTRGHRDTSPQFSPDGRVLAFLRAAPGGRPQLHVVDAEGGEPAPLTDAKLGVGEFCWAPDSARLAFIARVPEDGRYGTTDGVSAGQEDPRHITINQFQANGVGWIADRRPRLFVVDAPDLDAEPPVTPVGRAAKDADPDQPFSAVPAAHELTDGSSDVTEPVFTPDGSAIVYTSNGFTDADGVLRTELHQVDAAGGTPEVVLRDDELAFSHAVFSADGAWVYCLGSNLGPSGLDFVATNAVVYVAPTHALGTSTDADSASAAPAASSIDPGLGTSTDAGANTGSARPLTDAETFEPASGLVRAGSDGVLVVASTRGTTAVVRLAPTGEARTVWSGLPSAIAVAEVPGTDAVVATVTDVDTPGEVALITPPPGTDADSRTSTSAGTDTAASDVRTSEPGAAAGVRLLTDFAAGLRAASTIVRPIELTSTSSDGYQVHGWALVPEGEGPHPVLLAIHGGPYASYPATFFDEFQVFADAGYAVVACNPRGAAGYGQTHGAAIRYDFGNLDTIDVLGFLDHATATVPGLDATRVGIMGGSYGGYLTAWIIAHDHRFAGAIVERGFLDPASFVGASDIGWFFMAEYNGTDLAEQNRQSPMLLTERVRTPTFVVHSEHDLRCPLSQALRYYALLKASGVDTELLVFPGETHELSRSGTPWHRRQRFDAMLAWWAKHLPVGASGSE